MSLEEQVHPLLNMKQGWALLIPVLTLVFIGSTQAAQVSKDPFSRNKYISLWTSSCMVGGKSQSLKITVPEMNTMENVASILEVYRVAERSAGSIPPLLSELLREQCGCMAHFLAERRKDVTSPTQDYLVSDAKKSCMAGIAQNYQRFADAGNKFADAEDYEKAVDSYSGSLAIMPDNTFVLWSRARVYRRLKKYDLAIADLTRAIELDPEHDSNYTWRGVAYSEQGEADKAIADYTRALELKADDFTYASRGNEYAGKYDYENAIADYSSAIAVNVKYGYAYYERAKSHFRIGEFEKAISDYGKVIELDPSDADAYSGRGDALANIGKTNDAIADFNKAIGMSPQNAWAHGARARFNFIAGNFEIALPDFERAAEFDQKFAYYALWLEIANRRVNRPSRLSKSQSVIDMTVWPAPLVRLYLGEVAVGAVFDSAMKPDDTKALEQLCEAHFYGAEWKLMKGAIEDAIPLFQFASEKCPIDFIERYWAKAELKFLGKPQN